MTSQMARMLVYTDHVFVDNNYAQVNARPEGALDFPLEVARQQAYDWVKK